MSQISSYEHLSGPGSGTVTSVTGGVGINITGTPTVNPTVNLDVPVTVPHGGTGNTTFTAYSLIVAGTTNTGAFQNVVGVGTSGQFLQSQGAAALPQWVTDPGASGASTFHTDSGDATAASNAITIHGGSNISTSGATSVVTINVAGTTNHTVQLGNAGGSLTSLTNGTTGQVLTAQTGADPIWAAASSTGIVTINGTSGSVTGATVTLTGGTSGAIFTGVGTTMTESFNFLALPDTNAGGSIGYISFGGNKILHNYNSSFEPSLFLGINSGNFTNTGFNNTGIGWNTLPSVTNGNQNLAVGPSALHNLNTGAFNVALGIGCGFDITSGSNNILIGNDAGSSFETGSGNICIGDSAGSSLATSESNNILIGNSGVAADSGVIRIGTSPTQTTCYVAGIAGVTVANTQTVTINTATGQLGSHVMPGPSMGTYTSVNNAASPYTVQPTDYYISCDVTGGVITVLLPNAPLTSTVFAIKDKVGLSATSNITVTTVGGAVNIDGATSFVINTAYEAISVIFNGVSYEIF